jgi:methionyl-tRNA formyltransferase
VKTKRVVLLAKERPVVAAAMRDLAELGLTIVAVDAPAALPDGEVHRAAADLGAPVISTRQLYAALDGDPEAGVELGEVDAVLSFLYTRLIRPPLIELPRVACVNFHPAPLPDLRGLGPYSVALLEGRTEYGVSAHHVDEHFDTGDLIEVERFPMDPARDTVAALVERSLAALHGQLLRVAADLVAGTPLARTPQVGEGRYTSREDLEAMKQVLPDDPPEVVRRKIRAFWYPPYQGAWVEVAGERCTLVDDDLLAQLAES